MQRIHSKPFCLIPKELAGRPPFYTQLEVEPGAPKTIYDWIEFKLCWFNQIFLATLLLAVSIEAHTWNQLNDHYFDSQASKFASMKEQQAVYDSQKIWITCKSTLNF